MSQKTSAEIEMVVNNCVNTKEGRALLKYFIDIGTQTTFSNDPVMVGYWEGYRYHGRAFLNVLMEKHKDKITLVLSNEEFL